MHHFFSDNKRNSKTYGVNFNYTTDTVTRLKNSTGLIANSGTGVINDFNNIMPWAGMRRCNLADDGITVNAYYGEVGYIEDGSNGQVMVEVPAFYYNRALTGVDAEQMYISMSKLSGYELHPWFYNENGLPVTKKYFSAYEGSVYDVSASAYLSEDEQIADFTVTSGDKLCSVAGVKPCSGQTQNLTIVNSRILATNRGAKWQQQYFTAVSAIQLLFIIEYANLNSQAKIGQGVVSVPDVPDTNNNSVVTGETTILGNLSGKASGTDGLVSISYRGIENFWGDIWKWVDGLNINNGIAYISNINANFVSNIFNGQYISKETLKNADGYITKCTLNSNFKYGFLPTQVGGSSTSKFCDYYYQNSVGAFVALLGGYWSAGTYAGAFFWNLTYGSSYRARYIGARLCV